MQLAHLVMIAQLVLAADLSFEGIPNLEIEASCRAVENGAVSSVRQAARCRADEETALSTLEEEWDRFNDIQKRLCATFVRRGPPGSYVELLTCLEMGAGGPTPRGMRRSPVRMQSELE